MSRAFGGAGADLSREKLDGVKESSQVQTVGNDFGLATLVRRGGQSLADQHGPALDEGKTTLRKHFGPRPKQARGKPSALVHVAPWPPQATGTLEGAHRRSDRPSASLCVWSLATCHFRPPRQYKLGFGSLLVPAPRQEHGLSLWMKMVGNSSIFS